MRHATIHALPISIAATLALALYSRLALEGDLRSEPVVYLATYAALVAIGAFAWWRVRRGSTLDMKIALAAALLFRLVAALGEPTLSDDVYRYVWDGRVQVEGHHPYRYPPVDPELEPLRDDGWERINHPELRTIYPPLAEAFFAAVAFVRADDHAMRVALGLADFGVVLALLALLRRERLPISRVVLYAWCPAAVIETAGSGHLEPVGAVLLVLAVAAAGAGERVRAGAALAGAVLAKLLPIVVLPKLARSLGGRGAAAAVAVGLLGVVPYAATGPAIGSGLFDYAERWEWNAPVFPALRSAAEAVDTASALTPWVTRAKDALGDDALPWDLVYRRVWPEDVARGIAAVLAIGWIVGIARSRRFDLAEAVLWTIGGVLWLSPTVHPWYLLWIAPFAAMRASPGWMSLWLLSALAYLGGPEDVPASVKLVEYGVPAVLLAFELRRARGARTGNALGIETR